MKARVHVPLFITLALEEVSGQTHNQALYAPGKNLDNHWLGPRAGMHMLEKIKFLASVRKLDTELRSYI
jgi:hypothetical protein